MLISALWSHVCTVIVVEDPPPHPLASCPPSWLADPPRDGWLGRSAFALTKRACSRRRQCGWRDGVRGLHEVPGDRDGED